MVDDNVEKIDVALNENIYRNIGNKIEATMQGIYFSEGGGNLADKVLLKQRHFSILIVFVDRIVIMYSNSICLRDRENTAF